MCLPFAPLHVRIVIASTLCCGAAPGARAQPPITHAHPTMTRVEPLERLTDGPGFRVRSPWIAWGTPLLVARLREVMASYRERFPRARPIWIHDLSLPRGGPLRRHTSHRSGDDADIRLVLKGPAGPYIDATAHTLDRRRTWFFLVELVRTCDVEFILLDRGLQRALFRYARRHGVPEQTLALLLEYPARPSHWRPTRSDAAVVRHFRGHANHLHVRFRRADVPLQMPAAVTLCADGPPSLHSDLGVGGQRGTDRQPPVRDDPI